METDPTEATDVAPEFEPRGRLARGFATFADVLAAIGTIWIVILMLVIVADVLGRNFLDSPITGVAEVAGRSVVAIVFLQVTSAVMAGRMTRADFVSRIIAARAPTLLRTVNVLFSLAGALVFAAIVYATWPDLVSSWQRGEFFGVPGVWTIPTYPFRAVIVLGAAGATAAYIGLGVMHLTRPPREVRP